MRLTLRFYGWLFLIVGAFFVAGESLVVRLINGAGALGGAAPLAAGGPSLWLGLTGSLMAVIAFLALRLSRDPAQPAAWEALLLSKAISSGLYLVFAAASRNPVFLGAAAVDGAILVHLAWLRSRFERAGGPLDPRGSRSRAPFYEVWFVRLNDRQTGRAFWARYTIISRGQEREETCWAVFFDPLGAVDARRWQGSGEVGPGSFEAAGGEASWKLSWREGLCPPVAVIPSWLRALGMTRSGYVDAAPDARFDGWAARDGQRWEFRDAPGSVGHVWGGGYGRGWWWSHAVFGGGTSEETVFEILSAAGPLGTRATSAFLWRAGRLLRSSGPLKLLRNGSQRDGDRWFFKARFGGLQVEGSAALGPCAKLDYEGPEGERLVCRNSKVSSMVLRVTENEKTTSFETTTAALEFVEP